jgi:hypothetical protein
MKRCLSDLVLMTMTLTLAAPLATGDEGMWLFNHPPREHLKQKYDFEPSDAPAYGSTAADRDLSSRPTAW